MFSLFLYCSPVLIHLDIDVDVSDKLERCEERYSAEHEEKHVTREDGVTKELDSLQHARHVTALEVVEQRVQEYKDTRRSS